MCLVRSGIQSRPKGGNNFFQAVAAHFQRLRVPRRAVSDAHDMVPKSFLFLRGGIGKRSRTKKRTR